MKNTEGKEYILDLLDDTNHRPRFHSNHRHTQKIVNAFVDEVNEQSKHLPKDSVNLHFRFIVFDIVTQLAHSLDGLLNRSGTPADIRNLGVRLTAALVSAYKFAGIPAVIPKKTLTALSQVGKLVVKHHNAEC